MEKTDSWKPKPAKFRFKNIGPVKDAELELGDLTIIAGPNNTGKTYIAYSLYGFLKMYKEWPDLVIETENDTAGPLPNMELLARKMRKLAQAKQPVDWKTRQKLRTTFMRDLTRTFSGAWLPGVFSSPPSAFQGASIAVELANDLPGHEQLHKKVALPDGGVLSLRYDGLNIVMSLSKVKQRRLSFEISHALSSLYLQFLFPELPSDPFILSAERFGISLFYRELDFTKNQLVDLLQKMGDDKNRGKFSPFLFIDRTTSRYALPIKDNIDYTRSIPDFQGEKSEIYNAKLFDDIKDMMEGYYGNSGDDIRFISKARGKGRSFNIPLHLASSSSRGLSDFYFFLRHVAKSNHLLIIDEPESHLDTANQIQLARLLARFVRAGSKVLITTHSDYLIKEINNLVMLSQPFPDKDSVIKKFKYGKDDFLEADSIRAYVAENNGLSRCEVDEFGIDMPVFDRTIDEINKVANELSSRLSEDSEE